MWHPRRGRVPTRREVAIRRNPIIIGALGAALCILAACTDTAAVPRTVASGSCSGGDAIAPIEGKEKQYIFCSVTPNPEAANAGLQPSTAQLGTSVPKLDGLSWTALKSTKDTSAILLIEDRQDLPWGSLIGPAEAQVFKAFANDKSLGDWLIVITDVVVNGLVDPVPATARRWARQQVESYAKCGIPEAVPITGADSCTSAFLRAATTVVVAFPGGAPRGQ